MSAAKKRSGKKKTPRSSAPAPVPVRKERTYFATVSFAQTTDPKLFRRVVDLVHKVFQEAGVRAVGSGMYPLAWSTSPPGALQRRCTATLLWRGPRSDLSAALEAVFTAFDRDLGEETSYALGLHTSLQPNRSPDL
jgi:hypothetical protein